MNYPDAEGYERYCEQGDESNCLTFCKWCRRGTDNTNSVCDRCLRDIENDRRIDERRGK